MKLIIAGATGFLATEIINQALENSSITSIVGLARRPITVPNAGEHNEIKFKSVVCKDFLHISGDVKKELEGADACIWVLAVTPLRSKTTEWAEVQKVCYDFTVHGLKTLSALSKGAKQPLRFIYTSGANAVRDQTTKGGVLGEYGLLRGRCEAKVLELAEQSNGAVESCIMKPGLIKGMDREGVMQKTAEAFDASLSDIPVVDVRDVAATALFVAVNGIEQETLLNNDLHNIGRRVREDEV